VPSAGFEPVIPEIKQLQTFALNRTATEFITHICNADGPV
jgi:hypothetical protein